MMVRHRLAKSLRIIAVGTALASATPRTTVAASQAFASSDDPWVVPRLREWTPAAGEWRAAGHIRIVVTDSGLRDTAKLLSSELSEEGLHPGIATSGMPGKGDIVLALDKATDPQLGEEGYTLQVAAAVIIRANTTDGVFYGTRSLLQMLRTSAGSHRLRFGSARDWPRYRERIELIDVGRKFFPIEYLKQQVRLLSWYKLNTYHLHLSDWNGFRIESKRFPGLASKEHYTQAQIRDLVNYAHRYHVTIVPEIDMPAHSVVFSRFDPSLALKCDSMSRPTSVPWEGADAGGWTLDVTQPRVRAFATALLDEMVPLFDGPYFHIGGDEIPYDRSKDACPELVAYAKAHGYPYTNDAFVEFMNLLDGVVRRHGRTAQVWQWWDFQQKYSLAPSKYLVVNEWLGSPDKRAESGFRTIGEHDSVFYEAPGLREKYGEFGHPDLDRIYDYAYADHANLLGFTYSRWHDLAQNIRISYLDKRAQAPRQVFADRVWGGPKLARVDMLLERAEKIGEAPTAERSRAKP